MIETNQSHLEVNAASHPGVSGKQNEDRYKVISYQLSDKSKTLSTLAVLCDGIGGHKAGEIAAEMGVTIISETIVESNAKKPLEIIEKAVLRASDAIYQMSLSDRGRSGMGATCAIAWVIGNRLYTANLGDTRIYLLRDRHIIQLTTDHTWVQEAYEAGLINMEERATHPNAHVVRRYLGAKNALKPDFRMWFFEGESDKEALRNQGMQLEVDDILLLCSDGLTDLVGDQEIQRMIENNPLALALDILIQKSIIRGGHDNITVVLMKVPPKGVFEKAKRSRVFLGCLLSMILVSLIVTALLLGWRWRRNQLENIEMQMPGVTTTLLAPVDAAQTTEPFILEKTGILTEDAPDNLPTQKPSITPWPTNTSGP